MTRTLASLLVAGALACGCGEAAAPHKPARPKATATVSRAMDEEIDTALAGDANGDAS